MILLDVSINFDPGALPGFGTLSQLIGGFGAWGLMLALLGLILSACAWGLGHATGNIRWADSGKGGVLISFAVALLIGAGAPIINFFFHAGQGIH